MRDVGYRIILGLSAVMVVTAMSVNGAGVARASESSVSPAWAVEVPSNSSLSVAPVGQLLTVAPGLAAPSLGGLEEINPTGQTAWRASVEVQGLGFDGPSNVVEDSAGNSYLVVASGSGCEVESFDSNGTKRWVSQELPIACPDAMALGWDGKLYLGAREGFSKAPGIASIATSNGAVHFFTDGMDVTGLFPYAEGIAVVQDSTQFAFFKYTGKLISSINSGSAVDSAGYSAINGGSGKVFVAANNDTCTRPGVEEVTSSGVQWTWQGPTTLVGCGQTALTAAADGGVVLLDSQATSYVSISPTGKTQWIYRPTAPHNGTVYPYSLAPAVVDSDGEVLMPLGYQYVASDGSGASGIEVDFATQTSKLGPVGLTLYARRCGWTLARAHARSGDPVALAEYLGEGDQFDNSITDFAERYADQNERDHAEFVQAIRSGRLEAVQGV